MKAPRRLKDDPAVSDSLRDALLQEEEIVEDYDLGALREKVVNAPSTPPISPMPRAFRWLGVVAVSGFTAAVVSLALQPDPIRIEPTEAPGIEVLPSGEQQHPHRAVEPTEDAGEGGAPEERTAPAAPPTAAPTARTDASGAETDGSAMVSEPPAPATEAPGNAVRIHSPGPEPGIASTPVPSGLAAELAAYNLGLDAAQRGEWRTARDAYTRYLQDWPQGQMRTEGWLGLLGATVESSSPAAAERLAAQMLERGGLGSRREDVILVRAEALVQLDRCDEALASIEEFRRGSRVSSIKQSCKRARRTE